MHYVYILHSEKAHRFYFGSTKDLKTRLVQHNAGEVVSTKPFIPWTIAWYSAFGSQTEASAFERYLKTGSGRGFAYKHFLSEALVKDFVAGRKGSPKSLKMRT